MKPDRVLYLTLSPDAASKRGDYGTERYEKKEFQAIVAKNFEKLMDSSWLKINADKSIEELSEDIYADTIKVIQQSQTESLKKLWV